MKYQIILTEQADTDLRCIYEYIAFSLLEPVIAQGQLDRIEKGILSLAEMPEPILPVTIGHHLLMAERHIHMVLTILYFWYGV